MFILDYCYHLGRFVMWSSFQEPSIQCAPTHITISHRTNIILIFWSCALCRRRNTKNVYRRIVSLLRHTWNRCWRGRGKGGGGYVYVVIWMLHWPLAIFQNHHYYILNSTTTILYGVSLLWPKPKRFVYFIFSDISVTSNLSVIPYIYDSHIPYMNVLLCLFVFGDKCISFHWCLVAFRHPSIIYIARFFFYMWDT